MMEIIGTYERLSFRPDGDLEITFRVAASQKGEVMAGIDSIIISGVKDLNIKVGKQKRKRSLDANSYLWELWTKIARKMQDGGNPITKNEVYRKHIKAVGVFTTLAVTNEAVEKFIETWRRNGTGWVVEVVDSTLDGCKKVFAYHGSSTYSSAEMKRLIDRVIQDCIALGIETMTPAELDSLMKQWGRKDGKSGS